MTDITNYTEQQLRKLFTTLLITGGTTAACDGVKPMYKTGCAYDTESTTINERYIDHYTEKGVPIYKNRVKACFCYSYQFAIGEYYAIYRTKRAFLMCLVCLVESVKSVNSSMISSRLPVALLKPTIWS